MSPMFDKFTVRAKRVLMFAHDESRRLNHDYIGTEHLLLGLVRAKKGSAAKMLAGMGVDPAKVRDAVKAVTERGTHSVVGDISLTQRAKKVIEHAAEESHLMEHDYIGTEHFLLGLARDTNSTGARLLADMGVGPNKIRGAVEFAVGRGKQVKASNLSFTPGASKALGLAAEEARRLGHSEVGTGHLLLGLASEGEGLAAGELQGLGVDVQRVRRQVRQAVSQGEAS